MSNLLIIVQRNTQNHVLANFTPTNWA